MPYCRACIHYAENKTTATVKSPKGLMKPHKKYCACGKMKLLSANALGVYGYPVWCPLNKCQKTCMICGTRIREEEGDYCQKHR